MGKSWKIINSGISDAPVNVIKEDSEDENILYLGTDDGVYVSFDRGEKWQAFSNGLTNVAVHDVVVHSEAKDLLVGTHGRSIYKADISGLQQFSRVGNNSITLFEMAPVRSSRRWGYSFGQFYPPFEPNTTISFYSNANAEQVINIFSEGENRQRL